MAGESAMVKEVSKFSCSFGDSWSADFRVMFVTMKCRCGMLRDMSRKAGTKPEPSILVKSLNLRCVQVYS